MQTRRKAPRSLLTEADRYLADKLRERNQTVISPYRFFRLIQEMYREGDVRRLRKHTVPDERLYRKYFNRLRRVDIIGPDPDYGPQLVQVRVVSSQPVEEIVCLADPLCHLSHLSAMQRWGLTNRLPNVIICTRPNRHTARARLAEMMENHPYSLPPDRLRARPVNHPPHVRHRPVQVTESRTLGEYVQVSDNLLRLTTIGQTFLDMLQRPGLCGGMSHVLEVWDEHAETWHKEIIAVVNACNKKIVKCRAGHILEERLGIHHETISAWKTSAPQRGGSCKLDPTKAYASDFSESWMLSLNV